MHVCWCWLVQFGSCALQMCFEHVLVLVEMVCIVLGIDIDLMECYCFCMTFKIN